MLARVLKACRAWFSPTFSFSPGRLLLRPRKHPTHPRLAARHSRRVRLEPLEDRRLLSVFDFGDAPDPGYPTLLASDGARHEVGKLYLGLCVDGEPDGQPTLGADGDDTHGTADDEDGVIIAGPMTAGEPFTLTVTASVAGKLDAWVDFDRSGGWTAEEQICRSIALLAGPNAVTFPVSTGAALGSTFARFRLSSAGGLAPEGLAPDGEVEDYGVDIVAPPGEIRGLKWHDLDGDGQRDADEPGLAGVTIYLDSDGNGQLDAGEPSTVTAADDPHTPAVDETGTYAFAGVAPGSYLVAEVVPEGWIQKFPTSSWGGIQCVSVSADGMEGNGASTGPAISADGRFVAFTSEADNLVPGDVTGLYDVFVHDRLTGSIELVSVGLDGVGGDHSGLQPSVSADGRYVAFYSRSDNLVPGDTNGKADVFVRDLLTGTTERVSVSSPGGQSNGDSQTGCISGDGRYVAFWSNASNLVPGDTNGTNDVFVHDRETGTTQCASVDASGRPADASSSSPTISHDGRYVAFHSSATNLVPDDLNEEHDVFVLDLQTGTTELVSVADDGQQGNGRSYYPGISPDGRYVAFQSAASNLVPGDTNGTWDVFVYDRQTATMERVSLGAGRVQGNGGSTAPAISAGGRFVAFESEADNLVPADTNGCSDVFVVDRQSGVVRRVSVSASGIEGNWQSTMPSVSADGQFAAFASAASTIVPGDGNAAWDDQYDVFLNEAFPPVLDIEHLVEVQPGTAVEGVDFGDFRVPFKVNKIGPPDSFTLFDYDVTGVTIGVNDAILAASLEAADLSVDGLPAASVTLADYHTAVFALGRTLGSGAHQVSIARGALTDVQGTPLEPFATAITIEDDPIEVGPFAAVAPAGSLIYQASAVSTIDGPHDEDRFTMDLAAGQIVSMVVRETHGWDLRVSLMGPDGSVLRTGGGGDWALLAAVPVSTSGTYTVLVSDEGRTLAGPEWSVRVILNALPEKEAVYNSPNNNAASAEDLDGGFLSLGGGRAGRSAVLGTLPADAAEDDWYRFTLADGESSTLALAAQAESVVLELYDSQGALLAGGAPAANLTRAIQNFTDPTADAEPATYYVRVAGSGGDYSLLVTREASFDIEPNPGRGAAAQDVTSTGAALGYLDSSTYPVWEETLKLTSADLPAGAGLGYAVDFDGDTIVAGSPYDSYAGTRSGSACVFWRVGGQWKQQRLTAPEGAPGDNFGWSLAVSGDFVLVSTWEAGERLGAVHVYRREGDIWTYVQTLVSSSALANEYFGYSIAVDGDVAIVGAWSNDQRAVDAGAVYFFRYNGSQWVEEQQVLSPEEFVNARFGTCVAMDGDTALVSALGVDSPSRPLPVYVFRHEGKEWVHEQTLFSSGPSGDDFGGAIALRGNMAIVGAPWERTHGLDSGAAYVFRYDGSQWVEVTKLMASDGTAHDNFGGAVAIDGDTAMVGARGRDAIESQTGMAYVFEFDGVGWIERQKLVPCDAWNSHLFASAIALGDGRAVFGATIGDSGPERSGAVFVFAQETVLESDGYAFWVRPGDQLTVVTRTPGGPPGQFANALDPAVELYAPDGSLVAADDNGAADGRNALLTHTATTSGMYTVRVRAAAQSCGEYVLSVQGYTGNGLGEIRGLKWSDLDGDGLFEPDQGEPPVAGWTIFLDSDADMEFDPAEPCMLTGEDGSYVFTELPPGDYRVAEASDADWRQTFPVVAGIRTKRMSHGYDGSQPNDFCSSPQISGDGRYVIFVSPADNLVSSDTDSFQDIFLADRTRGTIVCLSVASDGSPGNNVSYSAAISFDGRFVALVSDAALTRGEGPRLFLRDRQSGTTEWIDYSGPGTPDISDDGRFIVYTHSTYTISVYDRQTRRSRLITVPYSGYQVNGNSQRPSITGDGRYVAFDSVASNLLPGDTNGRGDVFVYDSQTGSVELVSVACDGVQGNQASLGASISADGRYVVFESDASNLVPGDTNGQRDVFLFDRETRTIRPVSVAEDGTQGNGQSSNAHISGNGRYVAFYSTASNLVPGDTNRLGESFLYDVQSGALRRTSVTWEGKQAFGAGTIYDLSYDGLTFAVEASDWDLVPGDTNTKTDVFVQQLISPAVGTYAVSLKMGEVIDNLNFGNRWTPGYDCGAVDYRALAGQDLTAGEHWYRLVTARAGTLTLQANYDPSAGSAAVTLYDGARQQVADSHDGAGYERIDYTCGAAETYFACLSGGNASVDLRLANLVQQSGTAVAVAGTSGDDSFILELGTDYAVTINGVAYHFDPAGVTEIAFDGLSGGDSAVLGGSEGVDAIEMDPGSASLNTGSLLATVVNCPSITMRGGGGADTVVMNDSGEDDTFTSSPQTATLSGPGFTNTVEQMPNIYVYARNGGHDVAYLNGGSGKDKIKFESNVAWMYGGNYYLRPKFFDEVRANGKGGTTDTAIFYDTPGVDVLVANPNVTTVTTGALVRKATGFENVTVCGTNIDTATFKDSPGDDIFNGLNHKSYLYGSGYKIVSRGFKKVTATASTGFDKARLYDTAFDDRYECRPDVSKVTGGGTGGLAIEVRRFDKVSLVPTLGGFDTADLYDTEGNDRLDASGSLARLYRNAAVLELLYEALSVDRVTVHGSTGTNTRNVTLPLVFDLIFAGNW